MRHLKLIALILLLWGCNTEPKPSFASTVKELFFGVDLSGYYESNLKYYRSLDFLTESEPEGWTIYPPLSALGQNDTDTSYRSFVINDHPYNLTGFAKGRLNIEKLGSEKNALSNLLIYYVFKSKRNAEDAYQSLLEKFSKLNVIKKGAWIEDVEWTEFSDSTSRLPGLRISIDDGDEITNGYTVTISTMWDINSQ